MLEFVDSGLYFVQDENNFINPLLQVGSRSVEKITGSGFGGPKITGSDRIQIRILIPVRITDLKLKSDLHLFISSFFLSKSFKRIAVRKKRKSFILTYLIAFPPKKIVLPV